jgi:hypothetical protein
MKSLTNVSRALRAFPLLAITLLWISPALAQCNNIAGQWRMTISFGESQWTFTPTQQPNVYSGQELGLGNASGPVTVSGYKLGIDWRTPDETVGKVDVTLDSSCSVAEGPNDIKTGPLAGIYPVRFERLSVAGSAAGGAGVYNQPMISDAVVDWCQTWGSNCGQGGADYFCQSRGHNRALSFQTAAYNRTYVLGSRQICEGPNCGGFSQVVCERIDLSGTWAGSSNVPFAITKINDTTFEWRIGEEIGTISINDGNNLRAKWGGAPWGGGDATGHHIVGADGTLQIPLSHGNTFRRLRQ